MMRFIALAALIAVTLAADPDWNGLRVTFGVPGIGGAFSQMPRTVADATAAGFEKLDDHCANKGVGSEFQGVRYWLKADGATILLFDINGYIAGVQTSAPAGKYTPTPHNANKTMDKDDDRWTLTAYFVEPSVICSTGRSASDFDNQGTGVGLWLQNGLNPLTDTVHIPNDEADIKKTEWGSGKCFPLMGQHYWFNVKKDMDCDDFFPYCVLYTGGKLNAFCFAIDADIETSSRYEHPTSSEASTCCLDIPDCYKTDPRYQGKLTTMHVFMTHYPFLTNLCPLFEE